MSRSPSGTRVGVLVNNVLRARSVTVEVSSTFIPLEPEAGAIECGVGKTHLTFTAAWNAAVAAGGDQTIDCYSSGTAYNDQNVQTWNKTDSSTITVRQIDRDVLFEGTTAFELTTQLASVNGNMFFEGIVSKDCDASLGRRFIQTGSGGSSAAQQFIDVVRCKLEQGNDDRTIIQNRGPSITGCVVRMDSCIIIKTTGGVQEPIEAITNTTNWFEIRNCFFDCSKSTIGRVNNAVSGAPWTIHNSIAWMPSGNLFHFQDITGTSGSHNWTTAIFTNTKFTDSIINAVFSDDWNTLYQPVGQSTAAIKNGGTEADAPILDYNGNTITSFPTPIGAFVDLGNPFTVKQFPTTTPGALTVGTSKTHASIAAALAVAIDGDIIELFTGGSDYSSPGTITVSDSVTFRQMDKLSFLLGVGAFRVAGGKAVVFEDMDFTNLASGPTLAFSANDGEITCRRCRMDNVSSLLLELATFTGLTMTMESCIFSKDTVTSTMMNIVGTGGIFVMRNCTVEALNTALPFNITATPTTTIFNSAVTSLSGSAHYSVNFDNDDFNADTDGSSAGASSVTITFSDEYNSSQLPTEGFTLGDSGDVAERPSDALDIFRNPMGDETPIGAGVTGSGLVSV